VDYRADSTTALGHWRSSTVKPQMGADGRGLSQGNRMLSATALFHLPRYSGGGREGDLLAEKTSMRSAPSPARPRKYRGEGEHLRQHAIAKWMDLAQFETLI